MKRFNWRTLLPGSLAGQLISLLLFALFVSMVFSVWTFHDERRIALLQVARDNLLTRSISVAKLLEETPQELHSRILEASSSRFTAFWTGETPAAKEPDDHNVEIRLQKYLSNQFTPPRNVRIDVFDLRRRDHNYGGSKEDKDEWENRDRDERESHSKLSWRDVPEKERPPQFKKMMRRTFDLVVTIPLNTGQFLNVAASYKPPKRAMLPLVFQLGLMALAIVVIVVLAVRRVSKPLRELASAAEKLGRGEDISDLDESGPAEVRSVTRAFNDMQDRLTRFVRDRTRMLAAISHDLRTPITSLRIRAEFIEDEENRDKIIETLEEMAQMTEAALAFARDEAAKEDGQLTDLGGLLESLAGDQQDLGHQATVETGERLVISCRPVSLKRAFRNLIENGIRYGNAVTVRARRDGADAVVTITDKGPGIPEDRLADVFEPFVRLEESRSEETGGIGLGLAITRSIIHGHGGTITLKNGPEEGLEAEVRLPVGL